MANIGSGKIEAPLHGETARFQMLRQEFPEDELFGEVFRADNDVAAARLAGEYGQEQQSTGNGEKSAPGGY
jgi:hypothetical protein